MNWIQFMKVDFRLTKKQLSFFTIETYYESIDY